MTPQEIIESYGALLIKQYVDKPKARATIETEVQPVLMPIGGNIVVDTNGDYLVDTNGDIVVDGPITDLLPLALQQAFNLDTAVGVQLDILAKYANASRTGYLLDGTVVTLNDDDFRDFLKIVMSRNVMRSDLSTIDAFMNRFFPGVMQVFDYGYMHMSFVYLVAKGTNLFSEMFIMAGLLPAPLAVGKALLYNPNGSTFFGFGTYKTPSSGWGTGLNTYTGGFTQASILNYTNNIKIP
jgi:hypothetical protein